MNGPSARALREGGMGGSIPYKVGVTLQVKPKDSGPIPKEWLRKTTLQAPFGDFGHILRIDVSETQRCAYVEYEDPRDAQDAQKDLDGKRIAGKEVSVLLAGQTPNRRPGSSPMPAAVPERAVDIEQRVAEMAMKHFLDEAAAARLASVFQDRSRLGCNLARDFQDLDEHLSASNKPSALVSMKLSELRSGRPIGPCKYQGGKKRNIGDAIDPEIRASYQSSNYFGEKDDEPPHREARDRDRERERSERRDRGRDKERSRRGPEGVSDLRRSFVGWLKKAELELKQHRSDVRRGRQAFEEEKLSVWQQFVAEKQREVEKIREDRRHAEDEMATQLRQVQADIEESRQRIGEERMRVEQEGAQRRRGVAHEYEKFRQEYGLFEAERQRLANPQLAAETTVDLNVGGTIFETTRSTLVQQSGSFLETLLSGRYQISRDRYGRIFLNRDPEHFRTILNFLRNPQTPPMPRDAAESEALVQEATYYGVHFFPFPLVFAAGGHDGYEHLRAMEVLDVGNQCWRPCRAMVTERTYFGAATLRNRLHVYGGQNLDYKALCDVEIYDCLRDTWE
ncbi:KCTD3, partial [Symbiodinium sp. CCMP2456]